MMLIGDSEGENWSKTGQISKTVIQENFPEITISHNMLKQHTTPENVNPDMKTHSSKITRFKEKEN